MVTNVASFSHVVRDFQISLLLRLLKVRALTVLRGHGFQDVVMTSDSLTMI